MAVSTRRVSETTASSFALDDRDDNDRQTPEQLVSDVLNGDLIRDPLQFFTRATDSKGHVFNMGQVNLPYPFSALAAEIKESALFPLTTYAAIARDAAAHRLIELYSMLHEHPEDNPAFRNAYLLMEANAQISHLATLRHACLASAQAVLRCMEDELWDKALEALQKATDNLELTPRLETLWRDFAEDAGRAIVRRDARGARIPSDLTVEG